MSLLPATECSPKHVSESLAKDADLYIGIIGWRYGSPVRESPEVSYTQLEFRAAAEAGVPRLVFLLDEKLKPKDAGEPNFDRQVAFRDEIAESGITVQWFDSPEKLETKLFQSIAKPPGWDPSFLRMFLSAVDDAATHAPMVGLRAAAGVPLTARRIGSSEEAARDLDPVACSAEADRLVVLGAPGAGKSWLARQVARHAAERGFARLANRKPLEKIELPLLVAISPFFALVEQTPSVWGALVAQAVKELERFLPNHRCMSRIRRVLDPRNDRYFVILDGLDEAARLRTTTAKQVFDALIHDNCRLMLTSRPGNWRGQLDMTSKEGARRELKLETVELQPLKPSQVKHLVRGSVQEKEVADALLEYLERHPSLAEAARVPVIAQLIAIVGRAGTIRDFYDLYDRAINRLLRGEWRATESTENLRPYRVARALVEEWAWRSAVEQNDPVSGLGDWTDALDVDFQEPDPVVRSAVDNVFPVVERDLDRLIERRRFLHQTIREHLVVERIAGLSLDEAASELEPHLLVTTTRGTRSFPPPWPRTPSRQRCSAASLPVTRAIRRGPWPPSALGTASASSVTCSSVYAVRRRIRYGTAMPCCCRSSRVASRSATCRSRRKIGNGSRIQTSWPAASGLESCQCPTRSCPGFVLRRSVRPSDPILRQR